MLGMGREPITLPPFTDWTVDEETAIILGDELKIRQARNIIECGSGLSSVVIGAAAEQIEAVAMSLEDNREHYHVTLNALKATGPLPIAVFIAPMHTFQVTEPDKKRYTYRWYDIEVLPRLRGECDFVFVDGPPGNSATRARYPAVPLLWDRLKPGAHVLMDDTRRPDEMETIQLWKDRYGLTVVEEFDTARGLTLLQLPRKKIPVQVGKEI